MKNNILKFTSRGCSPIKIDREQQEIVALSMLTQCAKIERNQLEDFCAEMAVIMTKIANRDYEDFQQIDQDYGMLYSNTFITRKGAYQPTPDRSVFFA